MTTIIALSRSTLNILAGSKLTKWKHRPNMIIARNFPRTAPNFPQFLAGSKMIRIADTCIMDTIMDTAAWVTRPERPKGAKDEVKQARRAQSRPEGPLP